MHMIIYDIWYMDVSVNLRTTCVERFQELPEAQAKGVEVGRSHCEASNRGGQQKVREKEQQELCLLYTSPSPRDS